jgi:hypothetical protein
MQYSTPWVPTLNGKTLPSLKRLETILREQAVPRSKTDPSWVKTNLDDVIRKTPKAENAIWDCVMGVWRLKELAPDKEDDGEDELWSQHVSAWLVRLG